MRHINGIYTQAITAWRTALTGNSFDAVLKQFWSYVLRKVFGVPNKLMADFKRFPFPTEPGARRSFSLGFSFPSLRFTTNHWHPGLISEEPARVRAPVVNTMIAVRMIRL
jgi:hypothetical protein